MFTNKRLFNNQFFREIENKLRLKSPFDFQNEINNRKLYDTRRSVTKSKYLKDNLRRGYNRLTSMYLFPPNLTTLTDYQTKHYLDTICNLHIKDSQDLTILYFN